MFDTPGPDRQPRRDRAAGDAHLPRGSASARSRVLHRPRRRRAARARRRRGGAGRRATSTSTRSSRPPARRGADAVHPGYGFLSERAAFAAGARGRPASRWSARPPTVMEQMGRKDAAREIAVAAGVPGRAARRGRRRDWLPGAGQGRGRRRRQGHADRPRPPRSYDEAVAAAKREAPSAFGDDTMLVEKYVEHGRHIEVQVHRRHPRHRACTSSSATAPPSAGTRRCSRRRPRRRSTPRSASWSPARRSRWPRTSATSTPAPSSSCSTPTPARPTSSR